MISSQFREQVEAFIAAHDFKPTEFGRQAVGDPSCVSACKINPLSRGIGVQN